MINLGDKVKDSITGFKGIAIARIEYLNGCISYEVRPVKGGLFLEAEWIDEQVEATNNTASKVIEYCVRQIYGKDHNKAGRVNSGPDGGGTVLAKFNKNQASRL